jgi:hypothetical protein
MATALILSYAFSTLAALASVVSCAIVAFARRLRGSLRGALAACVLAALPGVVFVEHAFISSIRRHPGDPYPYALWTFLPAAFWIIMGPLLLAFSLKLARPSRAAMGVEGLRAALALGWLASSFMVIVFGAQV